jgi:hypothetical protein
MDERQVIEQLRRIEALFAEATSDGLPLAADAARDRIDERRRAIEEDDPPVEYKFSLQNMWSRRLFVALARRYGLAPYRYRGQRHTTVVLNVSRGFVDETLWPEFERIDQVLHAYLSHVTDRLISQVLYHDVSDAAEVYDQQTPPAPALPRPAVSIDSPPGLAPASPASTTSNVRSIVATESPTAATSTNRRRKRRRKGRRKKR